MKNYGVTNAWTLEAFNSKCKVKPKARALPK